MTGDVPIDEAKNNGAMTTYGVGPIGELAATKGILAGKAGLSEYHSVGSCARMGSGSISEASVGKNVVWSRVSP